MGLKKYFIATLLLILLVVGYSYSLDLGDYTLKFDIGIDGYSIEKTLPISIWIILPTIILFIATILHMLYYGLQGYLQRKSLFTDLSTIQDYIEKKVLNEKSNKRLKTKEFKELANIIDQLDISISDDKFESSNEDLNNIILKLKDINKNKYVDIKALKLDENNPIRIKNTINNISENSDYAITILKNSKKYTQDIIVAAFNSVIENKSINEIKPLIADIKMSNSMVAKLLLKDSTLNNEQRYTNTEILTLIQNNKLSNQELIQIAKNYKRTMQPEQLIKLFEDICAYDESLTTSYLYVLSEYEMISEIKEILVNSQKDEYIPFKAIIDLKDNGKHYNVESLIL